jgi:acid phosphatase
VWGWNSIGHLASAKLAYDRLGDAQRTALFALLQTHPHFHQYLAFGRPAAVSETEWVILRASVWPDWVRPRHNDRRGPLVTKYHRGEDHYVNVPIIDPKDTAAFAGKTLIPPDKPDIICALRERCNELRLSSVAPEDKAVAICWILHLVGDIHQPLHNAAYFSSEEGFRQGDEGGNKFGVKVNGRTWRLHTYWDDVLGEDANYADDSEQHQQEIFREAMKLADHLRGLHLPAADEKRLADDLTFESWSREGFEVAKTVAYQKTDGSGILNHVEVKKFGEPVPEDAPEAGTQYAVRARTTAEVRVVLAGRRLAQRITQLLENTSPSTAPGSASARAASPFSMQSRLGANLYIQTAAEYRACCLQIYKAAAIRLDTILSTATPKPSRPAVIMDLDETVLDNSAFASFLYENNLEYSDRLWDIYERDYPGKVALVPGSRQFIRKAEQRGVTVVFISNRLADNRESVIQALTRLQINTDGIINRLFLKQKDASSDKTARRAIVEARYNVLLVFGDNLRDFSETFAATKLTANDTVGAYNAAIQSRLRQVDDAACHFGVDWFVLPNPDYGEWDKLIGNEPVRRLRPSGMKSLDPKKR